MTTIETTASLITLPDYLHCLDIAFKQYFITEYSANDQFAPGNFHLTQADGNHNPFRAKTDNPPVIFNIKLNIANHDYFGHVKDYVTGHLQHLGKSFF
jgi:hypothetical protein